MANLVPSLSPDVFNQGAVRVNSDALTNYVLQTQARNQARDQAFAKYLAEQGNNINDKGVRADKDLPIIMAAKNDWQQHAIQNRRALQNPSMDGGRAYAENQKKYANVMNLIRQSQEAAKNNQEFEAIQRDPKKAALLTDASMGAFHKSQLPIGQGFEPMDFNDIYNPKPFDNTKLSRDVNSIHASYVPGAPVPSGGGMQNITSNKTFTPDNLSDIAVKGNYEYGHNTSFKNYMDTTVANHDSTLYHQLNDLYKQHYGKDIMTPEEGATAYMLSLHGEPATKTVSQKVPLEHLTPDQKFNEFKRRVDYRNEHRPAKAGKGGAAETATPIEDDVNKMVSDSKSNPRVISGIGMEPDKYNGYNLTPKIKNVFAEKITGANGRQQTIPLGELGFSKDGKTAKLIYYRGDSDEKGNPHIIKTLTKEIPIEQFKKQYGGAVYTKAQVLKESKIKKTNDPLGIF